MTVNVKDIITAATYNTLQSRVAQVLGTGDVGSDNGYGQSLSSSQVSATTVITATQLDNLRTDINKAKVHQTGSLSTLGDIAQKDLISADTISGDTTKGFNDYDNAVGTIQADKFLCDDTQASVEAAISSTRTTQWNGTITHSFNVTFTSANSRRHFFNSGGSIRFQAQLSNGSGSKDNDWATMLSNMGTISFAYNSTTATGSGTSTAIGNYQLTTNLQTIFTKNGSSVYAENAYVIKAKELSSSQIEFRIEFQDNDIGEGLNPPGYIPIDENVLYISGTITSSVTQRRATGSYVSVPSPSYTNTATL